ncbi:hypothetical protein [Planctomicrobium sp. SH664]
MKRLTNAQTAVLEGHIADLMPHAEPLALSVAGEGLDERQLRKALA